MFFRIDILTIMLHTSFQDTNTNHGREKGCSTTDWVNGLFLTCAFSQNELKVKKAVNTAPSCLSQILKNDYKYPLTCSGYDMTK